MQTHFLARYRFLKWGSKFRIFFYKTLKIFNDFSRENHGNGGHEQGVRMGVFGRKLSFKKMSAGGRLCTLPENPHFWVPTIKVRPPDVILLSYCFIYEAEPVWGYWHKDKIISNGMDDGLELMIGWYIIRTCDCSFRLVSISKSSHSFVRLVKLMLILLFRWILLKLKFT